jgi:hypothetical protein
MKLFSKLALVFCFVFLSVFSAFADNEPAKVVKEFCQLDYEGMRLSSHTYPAVRHLTTIEESEGWDTVVIIDKFDVTNTVITDNTAEVTVVYYVLGTADGDGLKETKAVKTVTFKLGKNSKGWKITYPDLEPHISKDALEVLE